MKILNPPLFFISLNSLICSLYTLEGNHEVFKKINLKSDLHLDIQSIEYFSSSNRVENFYELEKIFNKYSVKLFTFYLLTAFLNLNDFLKGGNTFINEEIDAETILLKKYLRKFRQNYKRYFFYQNGVYVNLPTKKEINMYAIESLFLLLGI